MDKHYSDEELLSDLDGEISKKRRRRINQHLEFCWSCRTRQAQLERQIQAISAQLQKLPVDTNWHIKALENIARFQSQFEEEFAPRRGATFLGPKGWSIAAVAACCVVLLGVILLRRPTSPPLTAKSVLHTTELAASKMTREPVHQVFQVREVQISPAGPTRDSHLEIWSDGPSDRFASKWTASDGRLKHAIWSTRDRSFVYASDKVQTFSAAHRGASNRSFAGTKADIRSVEAHFMSWLEERPWTPVVLLADMSLWQGDGANLRVDRLSARQIRLTVQRRNDGVEIDLVAVLQIDNPLPTIQKLRIKSGGRTVEFELSSEKTDTDPVFSSAVFYPDRELLTAQVRRSKSEPRLVPEPMVDRPKGMALTPDVDAIRRSIQAHFVLHLAGACRGVPVTVSQEADAVRISGSGGSDNTSYFTKDATVDDIMGTLAEMRQHRDVAAAEAAEKPEITALIADANALKLLAVDFDVSKMKQMPPAALNLLRRMVRDHTASLQRELATLRESPFVPDTRFQSASADTKPNDWREAARILAELSQPSDAAAGTSEVNGSQSRFASLVRVTGQMDELFEQEMTADERVASLTEAQKGSR